MADLRTHPNLKVVDVGDGTYELWLNTSLPATYDLHVTIEQLPMVRAIVLELELE